MPKADKKARNQLSNPLVITKMMDVVNEKRGKFLTGSDSLYLQSDLTNTMLENMLISSNLCKLPALKC